MVPYGAAEAIGPAWQHTKALLFKPLRAGRLLKLSLVALGAQLSFTFSSNFQRMAGMPRGLASVLIGLALVLTVVSIAVGVGLLYLGARLQLCLFDIVLLRDDRVALAWNRHGFHTWRWAGIKLAGMLGIGLLLSPLLIPAIGGMVALVHTMVPATGVGQQPAFNMPALRAFLVVFAQVFAVFLVFAVLYRLFLTLTLPVLALENRSFAGVFRQAGRFLAAEPGTMAAYAVLQFLVQLGLGLTVLVAWAVMVLVPAAVLGLAGWALWTLLHAGTAGMFVLGSLGAVAGAVLLVWALLSYVVMLGVVIVFAEAYGLYFIAGRYVPVAQYLMPAQMEPQPVLGFRE